MWAACAAGLQHFPPTGLSISIDFRSGKVLFVKKTFNEEVRRDWNAGKTHAALGYMVLTGVFAAAGWR